jgi:hypothetical protein
MEKYLSPEEAAALIPGMTKAALAQLRYAGGGPAYLKPTPRKVVYRESDVRAWLDANVFTRTDQQLASPAA